MKTITIIYLIIAIPLVATIIALKIKNYFLLKKMNKIIIISIQPKCVANILNGNKVLKLGE